MISIYPDPQNIPSLPLSPLKTDPTPNPNLLKRILTAVSQALSSLLNSLAKLFPCFYFFSDRKITSAPLPPAPFPLNDRQICNQSPLLPLNNEQKSERKSYQPPPYVEYDETLEQLRQTAREFVRMTVDVVHEQQIFPYIVTAQEAAPSVPPMIKSITKLLIEMGDKAAKPLFQKLATQKAETIDPTLKKVFNMLLRVDNIEFRSKLFEHLQNEMSLTNLPKGQKNLDYLKPVIEWVCSTEQQKRPLSVLLSDNNTLDGVLVNELCAKALDFYHSYRLMDLSQLYTSLEERLGNELKESQIPNEQDISKHYIRPILDWLLRSDQSEPIASLFIPKGRYDENLIDKTFELAITYIVEHNIDQYANRLDDLLQHQLQKIVYDTIQINAQNITDFLTERVSELIAALPFTKIFDNIMEEVVAQHIEACVEAQNAANASISHETAYLNKFAQHKSCTPFTQQIIHQQQLLTSQGKDPNNIRKAIEKAFFAHLTEKLFDLLFPLRKKVTGEGGIEEIDPFIELWQRLSFPEELYSLSHKIEEITQEFVTLDTRYLFGNIKQPALEIVRNIFKTTAQDIFKAQFVSLFQSAFEKLSLPEEVEAFMAETVLPNINEKMLSIAISQELSKSMQVLIPQFHALIKDNLNRESHVETIHKMLIPLVQSRFHEFSENRFHVAVTEAEGALLLTYKPLTTDDWVKLTHSIINETEQLLLKGMREDLLFPSLMPSEDELLTLYKKLTQPKAMSANPLYGEIAANLIFKLGGWPEYIGIGSFVKNLVSIKSTESIGEIRASHHYLTALISNVISKSFKNKERIFNLLYAPRSSSPTHTKKKLEHQIDILASLSHDLIMTNTEDQYKVVKFGVRKYIKEDSSAINALISDVYQKLFSRHTINENLLMHFCDKFFKGLQEADDTIKQKQQLTLHLKP